MTKLERFLSDEETKKDIKKSKAVLIVWTWIFAIIFLYTHLSDFLKILNT